MDRAVCYWSTMNKAQQLKVTVCRNFCRHLTWPQHFNCVLCSDDSAVDWGGLVLHRSPAAGGGGHTGRSWGSPSQSVAGAPTWQSLCAEPSGVAAVTLGWAVVIPGSIMKGMEVDLGSQRSLPQLDMSETLVSTIQRRSRSRGCSNSGGRRTTARLRWKDIRRRPEQNKMTWQIVWLSSYKRALSTDFKCIYIFIT